MSEIEKLQEENKRLLKRCELQRTEILQLRQAIDGLVLNDGGDLIPLDAWVKCVKNSQFIDYDGMGSFATATHHAGGAHCWVYPSDVTTGKFHPPHWATHILWYNR